MVNFLQKIKGGFGKKETGHALYIKDGVQPRHDWIVAFSGSVVCLCIIAAVSVYFYIQIDGGKLFTKNVEEEVGGASINDKLLQKTVDSIKARETRLNDLKLNPIKTPDPSL